MENIPAHPTVFITPEGLNYKPPKNWKPLLLIIGVVLVIGGLSLAGYYYRTSIQKNLQVLSSRLNIDKLFTPVAKKPTSQPQIIGKGTVSELVAKNPRSLFYANLEYNPKTGVVTQLQTGLMDSEQAPLLSNLPKDLTSANFAYKIEVLSPDGKSVLQSGWKVTFKKVVETDKGMYRFGVATPYKSNSIIKVYLPGNKLIWTGKAQVKTS